MMKKENLLVLKKVKKLIPKYSQDELIIGNFEKNKYIQFIPCLKGHHIGDDNFVCVFYITDVHLQKRLKCPNCEKDLMNELKGRGE